MEKPTRLFELIDYQLTHYPQPRALVHRDKGREISVFSTQEIVQKAEQLAKGLWQLGLRPEDKVASVIVQNRPEWIVLDLAMMQIGVIHVPVYPTISIADYTYIFNEAEVKYCFIGDDNTGSLYKKIKAVKDDLPTLLEVFTFDATDYAPCWTTLFAHSTEPMPIQSVGGWRAELERIKASVRPDDLATIIYTSGTTGHPKGVMLSHRNMVSNIMSLVNLMPFAPGERAISFLPLNHIFEKVATYCYIYLGINITQTGIDNLGGEDGDLKAVKPHIFTCVPRLLEKVYEKIYNKGLELRGVKRALFFWALGLTTDFNFNKTYSGLDKIKRNIADALIFKKWRDALGGNIKGIVVGASPCPVKIMRSFSAAGIPIREVYGMTELSPGVSANHLIGEKALLGTVGPVLDGLDVIIDTSDGNYAEGEGEIVVSGENIMLGYYKKPEETANVIRYIDGKKWLYTGDIGKFETHEGVQYLKITDRKKELFKTTGGKYVAPAPIENKIRENFLVEQVMLVGDNQKFVSALIVPATEALKDWCQQRGISWTHAQEIVNHQEVIKKYNEVVDKYNALLGQVEKIKTFRLIADTWEPVKADGSPGELTPTMKLKRRVILEKYKSVISDIYA